MSATIGALSTLGYVGPLSVMVAADERDRMVAQRCPTPCRNAWHLVASVRVQIANPLRMSATGLWSQGPDEIGS